MGQQETPSAEEIARIIPHCPSCGSDRYYSLTENAPMAFRLKSLRCEVCQHDILAEARQVEISQREPKSAPVWFASLAFLIALELLALTGLLWE